MEENNLNWDSDFAITFDFIEEKGNKELLYIPNNIYSLQLPNITPIGIAENNNLILTLRSVENGYVENEVIDILFKNKFNINISLKNPNKILWQFQNCTVTQIGFSTLSKKKTKSTPLNIIVYISADSAKYKGLSNVIEFRNQSFSDMVTTCSEQKKEEK